MDRVAGIQTSGSERAFDLYMKTPLPGPAAPRPRRYLRHRHADQQHHGRDVHDPALSRPRRAGRARHRAFRRLGGNLRRSGRDAWRSARTARPCGPAAAFAKFVNLPELQQMFRSFADVQTADMLNLPRPRSKAASRQVIACPMSEEQMRIQDGLVARYERIRAGRSTRGTTTRWRSPRTAASSPWMPG